MVKRSKQVVEAETNTIRNLMIDEGLPDFKIIQQLKIPQSTFYWYKKRILKKEEKIWDKVHIDSRKHRAMVLLDTLQNTYYINKQIAEDPKASHRDRQESSKIMSLAQRHMYDLVDKGPFAVYQLPVPALPVIEEVKELVDNASQTDNI